MEWKQHWADTRSTERRGLFLVFFEQLNQKERISFGMRNSQTISHQMIVNLPISP